MKHDPKLNNPEKDRVRIDITFLGGIKGDVRGTIRRTDDIFLTFEDGEKLLKDLNK